MPAFDEVTVTGDLTVEGKAKLKNTETEAMHVNGGETVKGDLTVGGSTQLGSSSMHSVKINGNLSVGGNTQLGASIIDTVNISGNVTVNGNVQMGKTMTDTVNIAGNQTIQGNLAVNGNTHLGKSASETVHVSGNEHVHGDLTVHGKVTLGKSDKSVSVNGDLDVIGTTRLKRLEVDGNTRIGDKTSDAVHFIGQVTMEGNLSVNDSLIVYENAQFGSVGSETVNMIGQLKNSVNGQIQVQPHNNIAILGEGNGIILTAPNKTCWLITVDNDGKLRTKKVHNPS